MVKQFRRKLNLILVVLAALLSSYMSVSAAPSGTIQVIVRDSAEQPVKDINVELLQVTECDGSGCTLTQDFAELGITAQQLHDAPDASHAEQAFQYAYAQGLGGVIQHTDKNGVVDFYGLKEGVYLVCEYGGQAVSFQPFLVTVPVRIDGREDYFVVSQPKTSDTDVKTMVCIKLWEDELDAAGKRPNSIKITLLRDGIPYRTATLTETTGWQYKFHMLPESGTYTVKEDPITQYEVEYLPAIEGYIVVNTYVSDGGGSGGGGGGGGGGEVPEEKPAHVSVSKVWDDDNNAAGKRPESITVQLILDGTVIRTAMLSESNYWKYTFTGLDGTKSYTVKEVAVPDYSAGYQGTAATGITITNVFSGTTDPGTPPSPVIPDPQLIDIPVRVEWVDQDDTAGKRPAVVTVSLIANGNVISVL